jgi:ATP-binding cassette subfamily D (ALD) long-chain fatty acid import protein
MDSYLGIGAGQPDEQVFFKLQNLDDRIKNPDQFLVVDAHHFSRALAELYSNIAKPILDVVLFNYQLSRSVGAEGLVVLTVLVQGSSVLRTYSLPAIQVVKGS